MRLEHHSEQFESTSNLHKHNHKFVAYVFKKKLKIVESFLHHQGISVLAIVQQQATLMKMNYIRGVLSTLN